MIILEGPDNGGKSTLGHLLQAKMNVKLIHSQRCDTSSADAFGMTSEEFCHHHAMRQLESDLIIRDRTYTISEWVYGNIIRGKSDMGNELHQDAFLNLYSRSYLIIYCRPPLAEILKNGERDQMEGVIENHSKLVNAYDQLMEEFRNMGLNVIWYDWTSEGSLERVTLKVTQYLNDYRRKLKSSMFITGAAHVKRT